MTESAKDTVATLAQPQATVTSPTNSNSGGSENPFNDPSTGSTPVASTTPQVSSLSSATPLSPPAAAVPTGDPRVAGLKAMFPDYDDTILCVYLTALSGLAER